DAVETGDRRYRGRGPGPDHDGPSGLQDGVADLNLARSGQPAAAAEEVSALALEALDGHAVVPVVGDLVAQASRHRRPVRRAGCAARQQWDAAALGERVRGADDRLAGDAAPVRAFAADEVHLDTGQGQPC